jgi:branched-chain amino acid transport system permease protein
LGMERETDRMNAQALELRPPAGVVLARSLLPVLGAVGLAVVLQLLIKPMLGDFYAKLLLDIGTNIILAVSLTMVNGFTGQFSIGHAGFMAVGAYTAAAIVYYGSHRIWGDALVHGGLLSTMFPGHQAPLVTGADLLFFAALIAGGVVAAICGYLVGLPSLRLKGDYLAIVTLGFGEVIRVLLESQTTEALWDPEQIAATPLYELPRYLGGALGFSGLPFYSSLFWAWLGAGITLLVAYRLKESSYGRAFLSIREDEIAAEAMGVHTTRYKVRAFVLAAFFAGVAGGIFAHTVGVQLNPRELGFQKSFDILIMVVLGGLGSISGAAIAAAGLTVLPELLRQPPTIMGWPLAVIIPVVVIWVLLSRRPVRTAVGLVLALAAWEAMRWFARERGINLSEYRMVLYALALIVIMIVRPQGLLGIREIWELRRPRRLAAAKETAATGESGRAGGEVSL